MKLFVVVIALWLWLWLWLWLSYGRPRKVNLYLWGLTSGLVSRGQAIQQYLNAKNRKSLALFKKKICAFYY